jgi:hypothetical protein
VAKRGKSSSTTALGYFIAGWAWFAANFWRAIADRSGSMAAGHALRLGSIELWFAGSCLLISILALAGSLMLLGQRR